MKKSVVCPTFEKAISLLSQRWTGLIINQNVVGSTPILCSPIFNRD